VQVLESHLPGGEREKQHHLAHQGHVETPAYQATLRRLADALPQGSSAPGPWLDFGCGPTRPLQRLIQARGIAMDAYDPLFAPDPGPLRHTYACIGCSETVEHFHRPGEAFDLVQSLLRPGGWLGILTLVLRRPEHLPDWWYANDFTHVAFYQPHTWLHLAARYGWEASFPDPNVALFRKPGGLNPGNC
jgi:hypothetical protein